MSVVEALPALGEAAGGLAAGSNAFAALDSAEFVKIMFTELANQDPMAPSDSKDLLQLISTIRQIQSDIDMSYKLASLVNHNEWTSASGLIGKLISGISESLHRVEGIEPGLSPHGQMNAVDFHVYRGEQEIATPDSATIETVWTAQGWGDRLARAVRESGARFSGPLEVPREPWHYRCDL